MTITDRTFFQYCYLTFYLCGLLTFIFSWFFPIPFGRFSRSGLGPTVPASLLWSLSSSPMVWLTIILFPYGQHAHNPKSWVLISPILIHYVYRTFIYPLRLYQNKFSKRFPMIIGVLKFVFSIVNAYLQTREISHYKYYDNDTWFWWRVLGGFLLFLWGIRVNIWAGHILTGLKGEDGEYRIPKGGWFEMVSCPNYFGELLEWLGWAIMTGSAVSFGFFFFSFATLVPRAHASHKWYLKTFKDYPKTRKAIVPFVF